MNYEEFFLEDLPARLRKLKRNSKPQWGRMSPEEMLQHLRQGILLSLNLKDVEVLTPAHKLPVYKDFLMSDRPLPKNTEAPQQLMWFEKPDADIEELKLELMKVVVEMQSYFSKNPEHTAIHPTFGRLRVEEWLQLHKKHVVHHCSQFGLI